MIRVVHPGSRIPDPDADFLPSRIPDPGVKKHPIPDPGSKTATLFQVHTPPPAKEPVEASLGENTLRPLVRGQRPWLGQEEDVETIVSFSAVL